MASTIRSTAMMTKRKAALLAQLREARRAAWRRDDTRTVLRAIDVECGMFDLYETGRRLVSSETAIVPAVCGDDLVHKVLAAQEEDARVEKQAALLHRRHCYTAGRPQRRRLGGQHAREQCWRRLAWASGWFIGHRRPTPRRSLDSGRY